MLSNCLFVFDKLTNNLPDVYICDQFFQPLKEQDKHNTGGSQHLLKACVRYFLSNFYFCNK